MAARACPGCKSIYVFDRDGPVAEPCPRCGQPMELATHEQVAEYLRELTEQEPTAPEDPVEG